MPTYAFGPFDLDESEHLLMLDDRRIVLSTKLLRDLPSLTISPVGALDGRAGRIGTDVS